MRHKHVIWNIPTRPSMNSLMKSFCYLTLLSFLILPSSCKKGLEEDHPILDNVLLITLDTTRADRLGCYGFETAQTPVLDRLAQEGVLFEQAHSHVPLTLPSHATIMSGKLPSSLGSRVNGIPVELGPDNLASFFSARGYWTGAVVSASVLDRHYGLNKGFSTYDDRMLRECMRADNPNEKSAEQVTDSALSILSNATQPYFLWVHYFDPHFVYDPPRPFSDIFKDDLYSGEIAYMDQQIGRLMRELESSQKLDNTLIVIAGDHGEGLGEHGEGAHGIFLYEYAMRIPLIFKWKEKLPEGKRCASLCSLTDIAPTIMDLLNLEGWEVDGLSLVPLIRNGSVKDRSIYIESYHSYLAYGWSPLRGMMDDTWKYIDAPKPELYRWKKNEAENSFREDHEFIRDTLRELKTIPALESKELKAIEDLKTDPSKADARKQLMSLGYLTGGPTDQSSDILPDPKDMIRLDEEMFQAAMMVKDGQVDAGIQKLKKLSELNPRNIKLLSLLGLTHMKTEQFDEAIGYFEKEIQVDPKSETPHLNMGTIYKKTGKYDLAEKEYAKALELLPRYPEAVANLAWIYMETGRSSQARSLLEHSIADEIESGDIYFELGVLEAKEDRFENAYRAFSKAVFFSPRKYRGYYNLAMAARSLGKDNEILPNLDRAAALGQQDATFLAELGNLFLKMKLKERALSCFQRVLVLEPGSPQAPRFKRLIAALSQVETKNRVTKDLKKAR